MSLEADLDDLLDKMESSSNSKKGGGDYMQRGNFATHCGVKPLDTKAMEGDEVMMPQLHATANEVDQMILCTSAVYFFVMLCVIWHTSVLDQRNIMRDSMFF